MDSVQGCLILHSFLYSVFTSGLTHTVWKICLSEDAAMARCYTLYKHFFLFLKHTSDLIESLREECSSPVQMLPDQWIMRQLACFSHGILSLARVEVWNQHGCYASLLSGWKWSWIKPKSDQSFYSDSYDLWPKEHIHSLFLWDISKIWSKRFSLDLANT